MQFWDELCKWDFSLFYYQNKFVFYDVNERQKLKPKYRGNVKKITFFISYQVCYFPFCVTRLKLGLFGRALLIRGDSILKNELLLWKEMKFLAKDVKITLYSSQTLQLQGRFNFWQIPLSENPSQSVFFTECLTFPLVYPAPLFTLWLQL